MKAKIKAILVNALLAIIIMAIIILTPLYFIDRHFDEKEDVIAVHKLNSLYTFIDWSVDLTIYDRDTAMEIYKELVSWPPQQATWQNFKEHMDEYHPQIGYGTEFEIITADRMLEDIDGVYQEICDISQALIHDEHKIYECIRDSLYLAENQMNDADFKEYLRKYDSIYVTPSKSEDDMLYRKKEILRSLYGSSYEEKADNYEEIIKLPLTDKILDLFSQRLEEYPETKYGIRYDYLTKEILLEEIVYASDIIGDAHSNIIYGDSSKRDFWGMMEELDQEAWEMLTEDEKAQCQAVLK